jgi:hypothetical protein
MLEARIEQLFLWFTEGFNPLVSVQESIE